MNNALERVNHHLDSGSSTGARSREEARRMRSERREARKKREEKEEIRKVGGGDMEREKVEWE